MNIYLIIEDGERFCIKANTMQEAIRESQEQYIDSLDHQYKDNNINVEKEYYHEQILQSCELIGELRN